MSELDPIEAMREAARDVLRELLPARLGDLPGDVPRDVPGDGRRDVPGDVPGDGRGDGVVPLVPAPPVAAVLRPSTWSGPAVPGEVVGEGTSAPVPAAPAQAPPPPAGAPGSARVEPVTIDGDEDLERFVRALLARFENPRDRRAIRSGRLRFVLRPSSANPPGPAGGRAGPVIRMEKGAVTERAVRAAAAEGARLVLARGAVLTPLARDQARALHVEIERER